jgi:hypothetical protein
MDDHDGLSGRFSSCLIGFGGVVLFLVGLLSVVSAVAPDVPIVPVVGYAPPDFLAAGDFITGVGAIVVGLTLMGRKGLASQVKKNGTYIRENYLNGGGS